MVVVQGLSCPAACGIFLGKETNLHPLHWQVDSSPLGREKSLIAGNLSLIKLQ